MIECAIKAFQTVLAMDADPTLPEKTFALPGKLTAHLAQTKQRLARCGIEEEEAEWIFAIKLGMKKSAVTTEERNLTRAQVKEIFALVDERLTGRPLWYVIGDTDFCGYTLKVDERVLIPRPETEELAMAVVAAAKDGDRILDLCTGSGAIAIAIQQEIVKAGRQVCVEAVDISEDALTLAKENAKANGAEITFIQSDLFQNVDGKFDIIVSNPPYIPTEEIKTLQREVKDFEPMLALDGGMDGLNVYRRIAAEAKNHVAAGGILIMEVGAGEAEAVAALFQDSTTAIVKDFNGVERYVRIVF
jgi:release factor glutamine methyltransferase